MADVDERPDKGQSPLQWMFRAEESATFARDYYLKRPFAVAGGCQAAVPLGTWEAIDRLLSRPDADVIVGRGGQATADRPRSLDELRPLMDQGLTTGLRHVHLLDDDFGRLGKEFATAWGGEVDVHLYCTPAHQPGFGWHYDAEEVFVLQTCGSKTWKLRRNTVNPWPLLETLPANQRYEREISPVMTCHLTAGDWLYVPSGYWHATAAEEPSISMSIGVRPVTAIDLYDSLRPRLLNSMLWRQRLPFRGVLNQDEVEQRANVLKGMCEQLRTDLETMLMSPHLLQEFVANCPADVQSPESGHSGSHAH